MVYIHIPYCRRRCTYCGFYSVTRMDEVEAYLDALKTELQARADGHAIQTLYIGGGTPTSLGISGLSRLLDAVGQCYDLSNLQECTVECNPEHLTPDFVAGLRDIAVVNRLSVGIQSFDDRVLHCINRVHDSATAQAALRRCAEAGFDNISVDFIYGLPNQQVGDFAADLERVSLLMSEGVAIHHLSAYALTVEEGSMLRRQIEKGLVTLPNEDVVLEEYKLLQDWCDSSGMVQYEVSNYCHEGYESKHNSRYWDRSCYCGYGASAHSFDGKVRRWNVSDTKQYITALRNGGVFYEEETLSGRDAFNETVMVSLRTRKGLDIKTVENQYLAHLVEGMGRFERNGWVTREGDRYRPTDAGLLWADYMAASLFL